MAGLFNGFIRNLEEVLEKPLLWSICLLHLNKSSLKHIFTAVDGRIEQTLACRILQYCTSQEKPSHSLSIFAAFCINIYFQLGFRLNFEAD